MSNFSSEIRDNVKGIKSAFGRNDSTSIGSILNKFTDINDAAKAMKFAVDVSPACSSYLSAFLLQLNSTLRFVF